MKRAMALGMVAVMGTVMFGCSNPMGGGGGGGGGGYKPDKCMNNMFAGDVNDLKEGRMLTYATEASGNKMTMTYKVCCKCNDAWCVEYWMDMGSMAYGYLFSVGMDGKIKKAWAAAKGEKKWTEIKVEEPPKVDGNGTGDKPEMTVTDEDKEVKAGKFTCKKIHTKMMVNGSPFESDSWFSKDVWCFMSKSEHGGMVAMDSASSKMWLEAKAEDAKPTMEMPK